MKGLVLIGHAIPNNNSHNPNPPKKPKKNAGKLGSKPNLYCPREGGKIIITKIRDLV